MCVISCDGGTTSTSTTGLITPVNESGTIDNLTITTVSEFPAHIDQGKSYISIYNNNLSPHFFILELNVQVA